MLLVIDGQAFFCLSPSNIWYQIRGVICPIPQMITTLVIQPLNLQHKKNPTATGNSIATIFGTDGEASHTLLRFCHHQSPLL